MLIDDIIKKEPYRFYLDGLTIDALRKSLTGSENIDAMYLETSSDTEGGGHKEVHWVMTERTLVRLAIEHTAITTSVFKKNEIVRVERFFQVINHFGLRTILRRVGINFRGGEMIELKFPENKGQQEAERFYELVSLIE